MQHYEILLLIHPDQSSQVPVMMEKYLSILEKAGGKIHRQEDWGKIQPAYQIKKLHKIHYFLLNVECSPTTLHELSNAFRFNDAIIRNLITKCDAAITSPSAFLKHKEQNEKRDKEPERSFVHQDKKVEASQESPEGE